MIRRMGTPPVKGQKYTQRSGAYAILPVPGGVLLTGQQGEWLDIQLPGGGIDPGESPLQTLHREVLEETGWAIAQPLSICPNMTYGPKNCARCLSPARRGAWPIRLNPTT